MGIKLVGPIMKKAFSLVELLIVVAILGILAAIVVPEFQSHTQQAKEAAAKDMLRIIRQQIEIYTTRHNGTPPGTYIGDNPARFEMEFHLNMIGEGYLSERPENPFNNLLSINVIIVENDPIPAEATGTYGWIYKLSTRDFRLDWPGTDKDGIRYYDY